MTKVSKSVFVPRPTEEVFTYLADFTNTAEWDPGVAEATKTSDGPVGFRSTFDLVTIFRGRRVPVTYEVTVYEPARRVVLVGRNKNFTGIDSDDEQPENAEITIDTAEKSREISAGEIDEHLENTGRLKPA